MAAKCCVTQQVTPDWEEALRQAGRISLCSRKTQRCPVVGRARLTHATQRVESATKSAKTQTHPGVQKVQAASCCKLKVGLLLLAILLLLLLLGDCSNCTYKATKGKDGAL